MNKTEKHFKKEIKEKYLTNLPKGMKAELITQAIEEFYRTDLPEMVKEEARKGIFKEIKNIINVNSGKRSKKIAEKAVKILINEKLPEVIAESVAAKIRHMLYQIKLQSLFDDE